MFMTANNFAFVILCVFSTARVLISHGLDLVSVGINTLCFVLGHCATIYGICHMGHFARNEVK